MADVTISSLPLGTPSGNALLPYSQNEVTRSTAVSAVLQNTSIIGVNLANPEVYGNTVVIKGKDSSTFIGNQPLGLGVLNGGNYDLVGIDFKNLSGNSLAGRIGVSVTGGGGYMSLGTSNNYSLGITNSALTIDPNGNVGIGTTTPTAKLDVNGNVKATNIPKFAWARFNGSGEIQASLGVTSIVPNGPNSNVYIVDVTAANFSNANYSITGMTRYNGTSCFMQLYTGDGSSTAYNPTTTRFYVATNNSSVGQVNHTNYIQVMGN